MAKVESIRRAPRRSHAGNRVANVSVNADALLAVLAAGHPPAFATDSRDRIVFWNQGMAGLLGRRADDALGRRCYETLGGRDVFGNRFCYANCPVMATLHEGDPVCRFEMKVASGGADPRPVGVTVLKVPGVRPDLFILVHILEPIAEEGRLARLLTGLTPRQEAGSPPSVDDALAGKPPLTPRETEVLHHVAAGLQNKEIAQKLSLSPATVRNHVHNILDKLGVHSKLEAVSLSFRSGWIPSEAGAPPSVRPAVPPLVRAEGS